MIGIIAAMESECLLLKEALLCKEEEPVCGIFFFVGSYGSEAVVLVQSGVGKVNAAMTATILIDHFDCDFIINTGIAGGLSHVQTGDVILGTKLVYSDVDASCFGYTLGQVPGMPAFFCPSLEAIVHFKQIFKKLKIDFKEALIYTADRFVKDQKELLLQIDRNATIVAEMEGAAIAQVCVRCGIPFMVLRYVSDIIGHPTQIKDYHEFEEEMAKRSSKICLEILKSWE